MLARSEEPARSWPPPPSLLPFLKFSVNIAFFFATRCLVICHVKMGQFCSESMFALRPKSFHSGASDLPRFLSLALGMEGGERGELDGTGWAVLSKCEYGFGRGADTALAAGAGSAEVSPGSRCWLGRLRYLRSFSRVCSSELAEAKWTSEGRGKSSAGGPED